MDVVKNFQLRISLFIALIIIEALLTTTNGEISRLDCKYEAYFDISVEKHKLRITPLVSFTGRSRRQCLLECLSFNPCLSVNYQATTGSCQLFMVSIEEGVQDLINDDTWNFIAASNRPGNTCYMLDPCENNGICRESCSSVGYECICDEFHYGQNCQNDLQNIMDNWCKSNMNINEPLHVRFDGNLENHNVYNWRCYARVSLREDGLLYSRKLSKYYTRPTQLTTLFLQYHKTSEYTVGDLGASCDDACQALGKKCNPRMRTLNSVYVFHHFGFKCRHPIGQNGIMTEYHEFADEPAYVPSTGFCYGFARLPSLVNCSAKSSTKQRLCRCM